MLRQAWAASSACLPSLPASSPGAVTAVAMVPAGPCRSAAEQAALDAWFVAEVVPLEQLLVGYIRRNLPPRHAAGEATDLRQDVFVRAFEAAAVQRPDNPRAFVMAIARNLLIDHARRAQVVAIDALEDLSLPEPACDAPPPDQVLSGRQELRLLVQALDTLPPGCRRVIELRKVAGMSQREVADQLGVTENAVEKQVSKGMRVLADFLLARGVELGHSMFGLRAAQRR